MCGQRHRDQAESVFISKAHALTDMSRTDNPAPGHYHIGSTMGSKNSSYYMDAAMTARGRQVREQAKAPLDTLLRRVEATAASSRDIGWLQAEANATTTDATAASTASTRKWRC